MKEYKVIALYVGGLNNKVFKSGDIVNERNFIPGRADELVTQGFLRPLEAPKAQVQSTPQADVNVHKGGGKRGKK